MAGRMIVEKAESFYDEMKISGKCIFCKGNKKTYCNNLGRYRYSHMRAPVITAAHLCYSIITINPT